MLHSQLKQIYLHLIDRLSSTELTLKKTHADKLEICYFDISIYFTHFYFYTHTPFF